MRAHCKNVVLSLTQNHFLREQHFVRSPLVEPFLKFCRAIDLDAGQRPCAGFFNGMDLLWLYCLCEALIFTLLIQSATMVSGCDVFVKCDRLLVVR
jgi:hypothetical protein